MARYTERSCRSKKARSPESVASLLEKLHYSYTARTDGKVCFCEGCKDNRNRIRRQIEKRCK